LRERPEDIPELTRHFLARFAAEEGKRTTRVSADALALLSTYRWPGNVRQLENAVFRAVVLAEGDAVGLDEFPQIASQIGGQARSHEYVPTASVAPEFAGPPSAESPPTAAEAGSHSLPVATSFAPSPDMPPAGTLMLLDANGDLRPLEDIETEAIRFAITHYRGQMSEVARRLRIGRSTLYRKLDSLGLDPGISDAETPAL
jgi:DNA-binding NtrC family response regulator